MFIRYVGGALCGLLAIALPATAQNWTNWTPTGAATTNIWTSIAASADGSRLVATALGGGIYTSTNSGTNWTPTGAPITNWICAASSANGSNLVAVTTSGLIYTNAGTNWAPTLATTNNWRSVASSADGTKLVAVGQETMIYSSTNAGANWQTNNAPILKWFSVASSADGAKLVAVVNGGLIYTNSGTNWAATRAPSNSWQCVASSANGSRLVAAPEYIGGDEIDSIYTSTDSGATWVSNNVPTNTTWQCVASSADGIKLLAAAGPGLVYTSTNSGATWVSNDVPSTNWFSAAASADGSKLWVGVATHTISGPIYAAQSTPTPELSIAPSNGQALISWLIPSMNFALRQNSNLTTTNWPAVTNTPILNLMNLQDQVIVPMTNAQRFYRLVSP